MKYSIHREGYLSIIIVSTFFISTNFLTYYFVPEYFLFRIFIGLLTFAVFAIVVWFFRIPNRKLNDDSNFIIAPADGKVVVIEETVDSEYFKEKRIQVSIFMSPTNVHVNRNPINGIVKYTKYHPGKYLVAWNPKSSTENERYSVVIGNGKHEILVKQIAGKLARRIVNYLKVGDEVKQTDELGFIKFGSRVDMLLPLGTKINVNLQDKVEGGMTVIGSLPEQ